MPNANARRRLATILDRLEEEAGAPAPLPPRRALDWILWENVAYLADDEKRARAFEALRRRTGLDAKRLRATPAAELVEIARLGGIHAELRAARLHEIAERVMEEHGGDLDSALALPERKALAALKKFPAIGTPGAENVLLMTRTAPILALESNGLRVLARLGYAGSGRSYDQTYREVRANVAADLRGLDCDALIRARELLRRHGKSTCKAGAPRCFECPVARQCDWFRAGTGGAA